jgi:preprotein translocase subunit YajC
MIKYLIAMQPANDQAGGGQLISTLIMFGAIFLIFYFMIIRPQQKRAKEREKILNSLEKGDKVITSGGIYGTIAGIDEKTVLLQIADNVKIKLEKSAINIVEKKS